jgi:hypothetical protein
LNAVVKVCHEGYVMTDQRPFTCHVFIGTSVDGFIARTNGDLEWLTSRGEAAGEYGFQEAGLP